MFLNTLDIFIKYFNISWIMVNTENNVHLMRNKNAYLLKFKNLKYTNEKKPIAKHEVCTL